MYAFDCSRRRLWICLGLTILTMGSANAAEGGASVYPEGAETVMPGRMPGAGQTLFAEFSDFYQASALVGSDGRALVPGFHLRVGALAVKLVHNWGVHVLGGTLVNMAAAPALYLHLDAPFGKGYKEGIGNADLETAIAYAKRDWSWWYGVEGYLPGLSYQKDALINIGQHNYATAPSGAFTYMPHHGRTEVSSKFQYIVNFEDGATHYRSGGELVWEYAGMQNVTKRLAVGFNGYLYRQLTDDMQNGVRYLDGNRGRNFAFGPEIRYHFDHYAMILKFQKDFLAENRPVGNSFWLQVGVPIGGAHHD